jgi:hypothetical protein
MLESLDEVGLHGRAREAVFGGNALRLLRLRETVPSGR